MNIFKHSFDNPTDEEVEILESYFRGYDYRGAGYTYIANYIWRNTHCLCWEVINDYLFMAGADCMIADPNMAISMPLTKDGNYDREKFKEAVLEAKRRFDERKRKFQMILIPGHMVEILEDTFPGQMEFTHDRDDDEYVYLKEKLISLSGRALHKKKNHMNYFLKNYSYEARKLTAEDRDEVLAFTDRMREAKDLDKDEAESLLMESEAIGEMMNLIDLPEVYSAGIYIDGKLQAFSIGERLNEDTAVAHFEKADDSFRGLYQVIAREFCLNLPEEIVYVNREEDIGIPNLRKAKEALRPNHMEEKYSGCFL